MAYLFHIQIEDIPGMQVWRRVLVPAGFTFSRFHRVIQASFGWEDAHPYEFSPSGWDSSPSIGSQFEKYFGDGAEQDSDRVLLCDIFREEGQPFTYIYDFGDEWVHRITLEKTTADAPAVAACVAGAGACPPEDCGGALDYVDFLKIVRTPAHSRHADLRDWAGLTEGQTWEEVRAFDLKAANKALEKI
jgi:hypothetical protein